MADKRCLLDQRLVHNNNSIESIACRSLGYNLAVMTSDYTCPGGQYQGSPGAFRGAVLQIKASSSTSTDSSWIRKHPNIRYGKPFIVKTDLNCLMINGKKSSEERDSQTLTLLNISHFFLRDSWTPFPCAIVSAPRV